MRKGDKKIFNTQETINDIISLREKGWTYPKIAKKYNCDHTSIIYQIQKYLKKGNVWSSRQSPILINIKRRKLDPNKFCQICEMLLKSPYHIKNSCIKNESIV